MLSFMLHTLAEAREISWENIARNLQFNPSSATEISFNLPICMLHAQAPWQSKWWGEIENLLNALFLSYLFPSCIIIFIAVFLTLSIFFFSGFVNFIDNNCVILLHSKCPSWRPRCLGREWILYNFRSRGFRQNTQHRGLLFTTNKKGFEVPACYFLFSREPIKVPTIVPGFRSRAIVTLRYVRVSGLHRGNHLNRPDGCDRRVSPRNPAVDRKWLHRPCVDGLDGPKRAITMLIERWRVYRRHCAAL